MTTSETVAARFGKAGWRVQPVEPLRGQPRWLGSASDGLATLELIGAEAQVATLVAVVAPDATEHARLAGTRLAALLALAAPNVLKAGWLANALRAPMPKAGKSVQVLETGGAQVRLTRNRRRSTVTLRVRRDVRMRQATSEPGAADERPISGGGSDDDDQ